MGSRRRFHGFYWFNWGISKKVADGLEYFPGPNFFVKWSHITPGQNEWIKKGLLGIDLKR